MLEVGGSGYWKASESRVEKCSYLLAVRNGRNAWGEDGEGFVVAKIRDVIPMPDRDGRLLIRFKEYAEVEIPNAWEGNRNPVFYTTLDALGINPVELTWERMPESPEQSVNSVRPLTIDEAKMGLAKSLGVSTSCIEITIRA
jgi:hypothetical protein